ncbi:MAG: cytochrome c oxidase subunit II [Planctomycetota bacterium]
MTLMTELLPSMNAMLALEIRGFGMPEQASTVAAEVDFVYNFITWLSIFFFVAIVGVMLYFCVKYRRGHGDNVRHAEQTSTHNTPLEVTWTIIPLLLAIGIFYVGMRGYLNLRTVPANAYEIDVTAKKWSWEFNYDDEAGSATTAALIVPVNRPVKLNMMSLDVLHSLFIPAFRVKQDIVPGRFTYHWFEATEVGEYDLFCTEYCGTGHSDMNAKVIVVEEEEFKERIKEEAEYINRYYEDKLQWAGLRIYQGRGCTQCHSLDGSEGIGPSFKQTYEMWGAERVFADGTSAIVDENYIMSSLRNPQDQVVANYAGAMPAQQFKLREMIAVARFIKSLNEVTDDAWVGLEEPADAQMSKEEAAEAAEQAAADEG